MPHGDDEQRRGRRAAERAQMVPLRPAHKIVTPQRRRFWRAGRDGGEAVIERHVEDESDEDAGREIERGAEDKVDGARSRPMPAAVINTARHTAAVPKKARAKSGL